MSNSIDFTLAQVYDLIESNDLEQARTLLKTLLETDRDNPDVWWLYAHSVDDPETARLALNSVLHLDPDYPQVKELLARLNAQIEDRESLGGSDEPSFLKAAISPIPLKSLGSSSSSVVAPDLPPPLGATVGFDKPVGAVAKPISSSSDTVPLYRRPGCLLAMGLIAALLIAGLGLLRLLTQQPISTITPVLTPEVAISELTPVVMPTSAEGIAQAFSAFTVLDNGIAQEVTTLGQTTVVRVCTVPGLEMRTTLLQSMDVLARQVSEIQNVAAIGVQVWDCSTDTMLRYMVVPVETAQAYVNDELNRESFEAEWVPAG
jgi:hypothetical protein